MSRHRTVVGMVVVLFASTLVGMLGSTPSYAAPTTRSHWPVGAPFKRTETTTAVWVGRDLIVFGVTCPGRVGTEHGCSGGRLVSAVYSLRTESWRPFRVPARFAREGFGAALSALMTTKEEAWFLVSGATVAVHPHTGRWREIPPAVTGSTCAAGRYAAVFGSNDLMGITALRLLGVDDHEWGIPALPSGFASSAVGGSPSCDADSVVVVKGDLRAQTCPVSGCTANPIRGSAFASVQRYDLASRQWSAIAPPGVEVQSGAAPVGHGPYIDFLNSSGGPGLRLTTATGTWTPIAPGPKFGEPPRVLIWARGLVVTYDRNELVVYRPV